MSACYIEIMDIGHLQRLRPDLRFEDELRFTVAGPLGWGTWLVNDKTMAWVARHHPGMVAYSRGDPPLTLAERVAFENWLEEIDTWRSGDEDESE